MASNQQNASESASFFIFIAGITIVFCLLFWDLYKAVLWAGVFALLFRPLFLYLSDKLGRRNNLAAAATSLIVLFVVIVPAVAIGIAIGKEATAYSEEFRNAADGSSTLFSRLADLIPPITGFAASFGIDFGEISARLSETIAAGSDFIAEKVVDIGQGIVRFIFTLLLMHYLLFYFLQDGPAIVNATLRAMPLGLVSRERLSSEIVTVTKSTMKGMLVIGVVQGIIGIATFLLLGIRGAVIWGVAIGVASIVPVVGTSLVWIPAALALLAAGQSIKALILVAVGALVIGLVDNLLRPLLIGRDTHIPEYVVLLSTLGALSMFGLSGFVIGPLTAAIFLSVWRFHLAGIDQQ
jgi:predicted PurR-regulated permease PerM